MGNTILESAAERLREITASASPSWRGWIPVLVVALIVIGIVAAVSFWAG
jgi:hypothetical protein